MFAPWLASTALLKCFLVYLEEPKSCKDTSKVFKNPSFIYYQSLIVAIFYVMVAKCFGSFPLLLLCHLWWEMIVVFVRGEHRKKFKNKTLQYPLEKAHSSRGVPPLGRVKVVKYQNLFPHLPSQTHTHTHLSKKCLSRDLTDSGTGPIPH